VVITCYHWFSSSVSWIHITSQFSYDIEYYPLTWLLDLLLSGIPTKILHKSLIYSSHTTCFTHLIFLIWSLKILQRQMKKICFPGGYWSVSAQRFSSWAMKLTSHLHIALKLEMLCPIPTLLHIILPQYVLLSIFLFPPTSQSQSFSPLNTLFSNTISLLKVYKILLIRC